MLPCRTIITVGLLLQLGFVTATAAADEPFARFVPFKRVEADPNSEYQLTQQHGPWLIFAASFAGQGAHAEAHRLVLELRKRFNLPAYVHEKHYDYSAPVQGLGLNQYGEPKSMRHQQAVRFDEVAVMVGNFSSVNDPQMAKTLEMLKFAQPASLKLDQDSRTTLRFAGLRYLQRRVNGDPKKQNKGPLGRAFVTRNPLLPQEYFAPEGMDAMVASMNEGVPYSLLDCPGKYSVRVATFRGNVVIDQKEVIQIEKTGRMESRLAVATEKAHQLVDLLRKRKVEAYLFHDRNESIVTVGSFNSVGSERADGKIEINPAVLRIMQSYGAQQQALPGQQMAGVQPRAMAGITFDVQPMPVQVPRRSIATDYAGTGRNWR